MRQRAGPRRSPLVGRGVATTGYRGWAAYQIVGAAGSYPANWTQPGSTSGNYATSIAAFKPHP